jgi:hypothetical protein
MAGRAWQRTEGDIMAARKQRKGILEGARAKYNLQGHNPSDLLPPARLHLLPVTTSQLCYHIMNPSRD